ncbi:zinc finger BED domain-containing protein RICESLEEPER 2-like protein [Tanacetum coccineum]
MSTTQDPIVLEDDQMIDDENGGNEEFQTNKRQKADNEQPKGERTKTAEVWNEFERVEKNGLTKARCNHCGSLLAYNKSRTTTTLTRHLKFHCGKRKLVIQKQGLLNFQPDGSNVSSSEPDLAPAIVNGKYDHMRMRESIAHWILMHEHSFSIVEEAGFDFMMKVGIPQWPGLSRTSAKYDCLRVYENQKIKLKEMLKKVDSISLTTDMWKSKCQKIGYMVITGHFLDKDWKLNKWVLNFVHVPPPHRGIDISDALYKCFQEWDIEKKIYSISMDNASANDNAIKNLKRIFEVDRKLLCDGRLFHVRCCAHILNLIAQDGLETIKSVIKNVRDSISFINASEARTRTFNDLAQQMKLPNKKLILDCKTRWNSTYEMLFGAYKFKEVFPKYEERDPDYESCPSMDDWVKVEQICEILVVFNNVYQFYIWK